MANQRHLDLLKQGVNSWNQWKHQQPFIAGADFYVANLSGADLHGADLSGVDFMGVDLSKADLSGASLSNRANLCQANLSEANLSGADFHGADLREAILSGSILIGTTLVGAYLYGANLNGANLRETDLRGADLSGTDLREANLGGANLHEADLRKADLSGANLHRADLSGANLITTIFREADLSETDLRGTYLKRSDLSETILRGANLSGLDLDNVDFSGKDLSDVKLNGASFIKTNFSHADLSDCSIYGIAAWDIQLDAQTIQKNLIITPPDQPAITVDNLKVAQFIYLLLNNTEIREVVDTITSKVVLILGRFTPERKVILNALREDLRKHNYLPVLFDFEKPTNRDLTETVSTLAHLARFIIVDLTDPSSAPHEVAAVIPHTVVPVQPLLLQEPLMVDGNVVERREYAMFEDLRRRHHWVLPTFRYQNTAEILASLQAQIIAPAEQKARELTQHK